MRAFHRYGRVRFDKIIAASDIAGIVIFVLRKTGRPDRQCVAGVFDLAIRSIPQIFALSARFHGKRNRFAGIIRDSDILRFGSKNAVCRFDNNAAGRCKIGFIHKCRKRFGIRAFNIQSRVFGKQVKDCRHVFILIIPKFAYRAAVKCSFGTHP